MDIASISQLVSSVGFPIAMCGLMAYYIKYTEDRHREEVSGLRDALNNNTTVLQKLVDALDKE
jgi:hypothetical protein